MTTKHTPVFLCILALTTVLSTASLAVPLGALDGSPQFPAIGNKESQDSPPLAAAWEAAAVSAQSGDTMYLFCDIETFSFGSSGGTDCWGWRDPEGTEYAIMGVYDGVVFVNTATMQVVGTVPYTIGCGWRDMKTYGHYCYAVSECSGTNQGIMVIDMQYLPDSLHLVGSVPINSLGHVTSHNLSIDTTNGYAYVEGTNSANFSIHILSLANPENPVYINSFGPANGLHDIYARDDTLYVAEGWNPFFSIYDVSNKNSPQLLVRVAVPFPGYVHNIWPTDDGRHVVTTEETANKTVKVWNIEDLGNVQLLGQYLASSNLAHNAQVKGDTIYISHYESGVAIVDISNPSSPVELAVFDTYVSENSNFNGCWGVYQYTSNNLVYGSNRDGTLFILQELEAVLADSLSGEDVEGYAGSQVRVDLYAVNTIPIRQFIIPINWTGPYDMTFDSVSTVGLRTEYFEEQTFVGYDVGNKRIAYSLKASNFGSSPDLPVGEGPILSVYFQIPLGASGAENPVTFTPFSSFEPIFGHPCLSYLPDTTSGSVTLFVACCVGIRGNVDGIGGELPDVADLTYLVDYLFRGGLLPPCDEEADVNGDGAINIADLTYLADYLFRAGSLRLFCP
jgi:choice-of-anchor B domain-containing protein